jgi:hypothetical protein
MKIKCFPFPIEILEARNKLKDPQNPHKLIKFSSSYKILFGAMCNIFNPHLPNSKSEKIVTYKEISDKCNISFSTVKNCMPILIYNFPDYFEKGGRKLGEGFTYKIKFNFIYK